MAYEIIHNAPRLGDFTALSEHQAQTPGTFFGTKAVLHLNCADAKLRVTAEDLAAQPDFAALGEGAPNGADEVEISGVDVWVTSR